MNTSDLIDQIENGDLNKASDTFSELLKTKVAGALEAKEVQIASSMFDVDGEN